MHLQTPRLTLREFEADDWPAVLAYQSDPRYLRYYEWTERTPETVRQFVGIFLAQQREQPRSRYQLAVTVTATGELIGNCGVRRATADSLDAEMGYEIAPQQWGHGYATEAAQAMLDFAFADLRLHRVAAWCVADNAGSIRVLQKLGLRQEGHLRETDYFKGRWWDTLVWAILRTEWQANRNRPAMMDGQRG
jgi:RimJ/RimL family protein N-acetyltransferase